MTTPTYFTSSGSFPRSIVIVSSSPSPFPLLLSPWCFTASFSSSGSLSCHHATAIFSLSAPRKIAPASRSIFSPPSDHDQPSPTLITSGVASVKSARNTPLLAPSSGEGAGISMGSTDNTGAFARKYPRKRCSWVVEIDGIWSNPLVLSFFFIDSSRSSYLMVKSVSFSVESSDHDMAPCRSPSIVASADVWLSWHPETMYTSLG
mmetsp:Transcript_6811/g.13449  ORF Transcript_6811/g.13449 Transcript_6811/m.13449 type:complete len:205 (-) Transcript_6811:431-1045(-)